MFGYITPNGKALDEAALEKYRAGYCGVCRQLQQRQGALGRMMLSYDMAFLHALLTSLYEPETVTERARCITHPAKPLPYSVNRFTGYVADMNFALGYHKLRDNWQDDHSLLGGAGSRALQGRYARVAEQHPEQCRTIETELQALAEIERLRNAPIDAAANCFGRILGRIFVPEPDVWQDALYATGAALGRFIYMMDAYEDLPRDKRKGQYNPLLPIADAPDFEARAYDLLTIPMVECTQAFETLPLVEDVETLRNILYAGVWMRYQAIHQTRTRPAKGKHT